MTKPFDTYFGGKAGSGTYQTIINQIPRHRVYVEPFVGGGAIFRHKREAKLNVLWDMDEEVVSRWVQMLDVVPYNGIDFNGSGFLVEQRNSVDYLRVKKNVLDRRDFFIYVDPPYPISSRKSDTRYKYELTDEAHRQLLAVLDSYRHARIAISTYPNDLYAETLSHWRRIEFESTTRGGMATEWLLMNYPEPTDLHDYRYVGSDYRERERIAKKVKRHVRKFNALPVLERNALLQALNESRQ